MFILNEAACAGVNMRKYAWSIVCYKAFTQLNSHREVKAL